MVGDWQHAESPLMRARMSDVHTERYSPMYPAVDAFEAEREARSILADVEPVRRFTGEPDPYAYMVADWPGFRGSMYACALAESLRSFVEGC